MSQESLAVAEATEAVAVTTQTAITLRYAGASRLLPADDSNQLALFGNTNRAPVQFAGRVRDALLFRESLATIYAIVGSDQRYVPKDRTAYLAYQRMRKATANMAAWQAQQAYFEWLSLNAPEATSVLDPLVSVHPDRLLFEVFSKDEGCYACLALRRGDDANAVFEDEAPPVFGTTNIDFSATLLSGVMGLRSYRDTRLAIGSDASTMNAPETGVIEKQLHVPDAWLRGFLQVQSAATLASESFKLSPIDLYNMLRYLRMHADVKRKRRGLRIELIPGEQPTLVLEPWEQVLPATSDIYRGHKAQVIRVWGRRRLLLLRRLLPFVDEVQVHTLGSGLPSYWVLRSEQMTMLLGLTGFTSANWSQAAAFDLLLPRHTDDAKPLDKVVKHLGKQWQQDGETLGKAVKLKPADLQQTLQTGCQQGQLMYDLAEDVYRLRPVSDTPLDRTRLEYRNNRERSAHDLLARQNAVAITQENRIHGSGLELTGKVDVAEDRREYRPMLLLSDEGQVSKAECTCNFYRQQGLQHGPCTHLIALRLAYAQSQTADGKRSRRAIVTETRTFSKRDHSGEQVYQLTLDRNRLRVRWGRAGEDLRSQQLRFADNAAAHDDYTTRVESLTTRGFLDASAE